MIEPNPFPVSESLWVCVTFSLLCVNSGWEASMAHELWLTHPPNPPTMPLLHLDFQSCVVTLETLTPSNPSVSLVSHCLSQEMSGGRRFSWRLGQGLYFIFLFIWIWENTLRIAQAETKRNIAQEAMRERSRRADALVQWWRNVFRVIILSLETVRPLSSLLISFENGIARGSSGSRLVSSSCCDFLALAWC